ncbi:hypothetical protein KP509_12G071600 [Ceratopteris richardii]|uniref:Uncharacterized protein n=1 Tax=Ceratopteris richardii TaxID=49495 RepID=A0A8T2TMX6_CERRI|nr:hypothetical protein KP509_12G071600 [Ceratopteris richardii]
MHMWAKQTCMHMCTKQACMHTYIYTQAYIRSCRHTRRLSFMQEGRQRIYYFVKIATVLETVYTIKALKILQNLGTEYHHPSTASKDCTCQIITLTLVCTKTCIQRQ